MTIGLVGRKSGMTRVFTEDGNSIPVSVVEVEPNRITQLKTTEHDGYDAVQVTVGERRATRVKKSAAGHFSKAETGAGRGLWELRLNDASEELAVGSALTVDSFEAGQKIDVTGQSKGKGFQGGIKRWNFTMQDATHGNSISHRSNGSIGQCQTPGRVFKGKKMSGHMGAEQVTVQNLEVVRVDAERNLILVKGAIPGAPGGDVLIKPAVKAKA
ncbi:MAG: 50S ribosomal protein L3 [Gammaproteobacteria bacterium]|nr:50S ribosomal protein L3 [Gammaproteobacteria bacterium]MBT8149957.1 50S ribosomal protein L3 [Gammaproteobacteria bacterium]NND40011.1 50S ribosomal protein L3 [Pseudomonadales bacterium]NNM11304.1 50S ribosomal protein L3 [Pseudomonadales bacterium]